MAQKKAGGSTRNGRDSRGQRLGVKIFGGSVAHPGCIIVRQRGTRYYPGENTCMGRDHTIHSIIKGIVKFYSRSCKWFISVEPTKPIEE